MGSVYEADYYTVSAAEEVRGEYVAKDEIPKREKKLRKEMMTAAKELEFERAAELRDEIKKLEELELRYK